MEWQIIPTGRVWVDPGGPFGLVPRTLWQRHRPANEHNLVPMDLNCLLIHSNGKVILVDTGLGDKLSPKAQRNWNLSHPHGTLLENLAKAGVGPRDVDVVIDTHLHSDHCGGNTCIIDGRVSPTFPRAEYLVQRMEWADAMHPDARTRGTYLLENYRPVWESGQFHFLHGDTQVTDEVHCVLTRGHTRGHQSVILTGGDQPIMFVADLATYAVHMARQAWVTAYDVEPLENIATKAHWQTWALENNALLVFEHDTHTPLGQLTRDKNNRTAIQPVEASPALELLR